MSSLWWQAPELLPELEAVLDRLNEARRFLRKRQRGAEVERRIKKGLAALAKMETTLTGATGVEPDQVPQQVADLDAVVDGSLGEPSTKLAIYGTLAPGEVNHRLVADLLGVWYEGLVRGKLHRVGWGAGYGFPALSWRPDGERVPVKLLVAVGLRHRWPRLDAFEGEQYRRILVPVESRGKTLAVANLYATRR